VFLFDEPLSNLDAKLRSQMRTEIKLLHARVPSTVVYVTHDQVEAMTLADVLWVMNGGVVEQKGAPLEVYERPRTRFVAGFLGSPQINFVEGTLVKQDGAWRAEGGGVLAPVDEERFGSSLVEGRPVVVGIRPHDFFLVQGGAPPAATLKVELVEALGFEAFAHGWLRASGPRVVARLEAADAKRVKAGEAVPLGALPAHVHLFDPKTGLALDVRS